MIDFPHHCVNRRWAPNCLVRFPILKWGGGDGDVEEIKTVREGDGDSEGDEGRRRFLKADGDNL
jgi:hypothetical protein